MIRFVTTRSHRYTLQDLIARSARLDLEVVTYDWLFARRFLSRATYVLTDLDRLGFWDLELAAHVYRLLTKEGLRVLNDPARVRQRVSLLRALRARGINDFSVYRAEDDEWPESYPAFLRTQSAHRGTVSDLVHSQAEAEASLAEAIDSGFALRDLIFVEFCAEPLRRDLYRKHSTFRVGNRMVATTCVHDRGWTVKYGAQGIATEADYLEEYAFVRDNTFAETIRPAFDLGCIDYGRADFGFVGGRPQIYEINTNPDIRILDSHPQPIRVEASRVFLAQLQQALAEIDYAGPTGRVELDTQRFRGQRKRDRWVLQSRHTD